MRQNMIEIEIPLHAHFEKPDRNGNIFSRDAFESFFDSEYYKETVNLYNGFPITREVEVDADINRMLTIRPEEVIGVAKSIKLDEKCAICDLAINPEFLKSVKPALGVRAVARVNPEGDHNRCEIVRIVSFDLLDATDNPCE